MDNGESIKGSKILSCLHESLTYIGERETVIEVPPPKKKIKKTKTEINESNIS